MRLSQKWRIGLFVGGVLIYLLGAFGWWTVALFDFVERDRELNYKVYNTDSIHVVGEMTHAIISGKIKGKDSAVFYYKGQKLVVDTAKIKGMVLQHFPNYSIALNPGKEVSKSIKVELKDVIRNELERNYQRSKSEFLQEGLSIMVLILISMATLYLYFDRIIEFNLQQNNFLLAVTHELKTPVAAAKLAIQTIQRQELDKEKTDKLLNVADANLSRLADLMENVLIATRIEGKVHQLQNQDIDLQGFVEDILNDLKPSFPPSATVDRRLKAGLTLIGDRHTLGFAISNLVSNALKYSKKGEEVVIVRSGIERGKVILEVIDNGDGIPDKEKKKIFQKFYRVGDERTRSSRGTGLGLYLVRKIAKMHKAEVEVCDNPSGGSVFKLVFKDNLTKR